MSEYKPPWGFGGRVRRKLWTPGAREDDPDARTVHSPLAEEGPGVGAAFFFLFGFKTEDAHDQSFLQRELRHIDDDVEALRRAGYTVVVDEQATRRDFLQMLRGEGEGGEGLRPAGFYWSAHGLSDGSIEACDGSTISPLDIHPDEVADGLRLAVMAACYVGSRSQTWRERLGGEALVVGWGRPVTISRAEEFLKENPETETDLDDLIQRYLIDEAPLPRPDDARTSPLRPASEGGALGNLPERVGLLQSMLGARVTEEEDHVEVRVPLGDKRSHVARVFVVVSTEPYSEGEPLLGVEARVGPLTEVTNARALLANVAAPGYARVAVVQGEGEMPLVVTQGFLPLGRVRDNDLATLIYQVCWQADQLENQLFGIDD